MMRATVLVVVIVLAGATAGRAAPNDVVGWTQWGVGTLIGLIGVGVTALVGIATFLRRVSDVSRQQGRDGHRVDTLEGGLRETRATVAAIERRMDAAEKTGDRVADHDRRLESLESTVVAIRDIVHQSQQDVLRELSAIREEMARMNGARS